MKLALFRSHIITLVISLACAAYMLPMIKSVFDITWRSCGDPTCVSISELEANPNPDCWTVVVTDAQVLDVPDTLSAEELFDERSLIPIGPKSQVRDAASAKVFLRVRADSVQQAHEMLNQASLQGQLNELKSGHSDLLKQHYPDTDWSTARIINTTREHSPLKMLLVCAFGFMIMTACPLAMIGSMVWHYLDEKKWAAKLNEPADYSLHPDAINLAGATRLGGSRKRSLERDHDIPEPEGEAKPDSWKSKLPGLVCMWIGYSSVNMMFSSSDTMASPLFLCSLGGLVLSFAGAGYLRAKNVKKSPALAPNDVLMDGEPAFAQTAWHQYQDKRLRELDFRMVSHLLRTGVMCRSIYLSHDGNVLVEVGVQGGARFVCVESLLSDNSCVETHTLISPKTAVDRLQQAKLIRQAAKGMELLDVLDAHERSVRNALFATGSLEVELTEENYKAMLAYVNVVCTLERRNRKGAAVQLLG